jgi:serine protease Do
MTRTIRTRVVLCVMALSLAAGLVSAQWHAALGIEPPGSFAPIARAALAASIIIRRMDYAGEPLTAPYSGPEESEFADGSARRARNAGSGVIVDPRGIALASARVVGLGPVEVALVDGTLLKADVVGVDWRTDVAVLRIRGDAPLPYVALGDSDHLRVGDWVVAVGVPLGLAGTVTAGVVTALPAPADPNPLGSFLQTDAAIGQGFVGGPLLAMNGELVGLATALRAEGIAYALPSRTVRKVYRELLENGRVSRPWLGAIMQRLGPDLARAFGTRTADGVLIADVLPKSPAARAGLRSGDVLLEIDGQAASTPTQVDRTINLRSAGETIRLKIRQATRERSVAVRLAEEPVAFESHPDLIRARRLLGIDVRPVTPTMGAVVVEVDLESPADLVGLEPGDVIREIDRKPIANFTDFQIAARRIKGAQDVLMLLQRAEVAVYVMVRARPDL